MINSILDSLTFGQFMFLFVFCVVGGGVLLMAVLFWWWHKLPGLNQEYDHVYTDENSVTYWREPDDPAQVKKNPLP